VHAYHHNLIALGDVNIDRRHDPLYQAFTSTGLTVPPALHEVPRTIFGSHLDSYYDQIAWLAEQRSRIPKLSLTPTGAAGSFDVGGYVHRDLTRQQVSWRSPTTSRCGSSSPTDPAGSELEHGDGEVAAEALGERGRPAPRPRPTAPDEEDLVDDLAVERAGDHPQRDRLVDVAVHVQPGSAEPIEDGRQPPSRHDEPRVLGTRGQHPLVAREVQDPVRGSSGGSDQTELPSVPLLVPSDEPCRDRLCVHGVEEHEAGPDLGLDVHLLQDDRSLLEDHPRHLASPSRSRLGANTRSMLRPPAAGDIRQMTYLWSTDHDGPRRLAR
jgi:hypothetical protein